jgi:hypothetical protein
LEDAIMRISGGLLEQVVLTGQNGKQLMTIVVKDPQCEDYETNSKFVQEASEELQKNISFQTKFVNAI